MKKAVRRRKAQKATRCFKKEGTEPMRVLKKHDGETDRQILLRLKTEKLVSKAMARRPGERRIKLLARITRIGNEYYKEIDLTGDETK